MATNAEEFGDDWQAEVERRVLAEITPDSDKSSEWIVTVVEHVAAATADLAVDDAEGFDWQVLDSGEQFRVCDGCGGIIDTDSEGRWSSLKEVWACDGCIESAGQSRSVAWLIDEYGQHRFHVTDYEITAQDGDDIEGVLERSWVSSSAWRGYYETKPVDGEWREAESGWTTGGWGDPVAESKRSFNEWAEGVVAGGIEVPCPVWIITDPTSNLFSTAVGVFVPADFEGDICVPKF